VVMLVVGAVIGAIVAAQRTDIAFTSVFIWAFVAIALRQIATSAVLVTALGGALAMAAILLWSYGKRKTTSSPLD
jgi:hypothetical protein